MTIREQIAGGGIITRQSETGLEVLLIFRRGVWDLPKGKIDRGETIQECARREVMEEVGIDDVDIVEFLDTTAHGYNGKKSGVFVVKTTHWYLMKTSATRFKPQKKEKIKKVKWVSVKKAKKKLGYDSLVRLLERTGPRLR